MSPRVLLAVLCFLPALVAGAEPAATPSVAWFLEHPDALAEQIERCRADPGGAGPECVNAEQALARRSWPAVPLTLAPAEHDAVLARWHRAWADSSLVTAAVKWVVAPLKGLARLALTLSILLLALGLLAGRSMSAGQLLYRAIPVVVVGAIGLSADGYQQAVAGIARALAGWAQGLQEVLGADPLLRIGALAQQWGAYYFHQAVLGAAGPAAWLWMLGGLSVLLAQGLLLALSMALTLGPGLALALLLAVGPVFLLLWVFPPLAAWAGAWMRAAILAIVGMALGPAGARLVGQVYLSLLRPEPGPDPLGFALYTSGLALAHSLALLALAGLIVLLRPAMALGRAREVPPRQRIRTEAAAPRSWGDRAPAVTVWAPGSVAPRGMPGAVPFTLRSVPRGGSAAALPPPRGRWSWAAPRGAAARRVRK